MDFIEKVTAFITRYKNDEIELLLCQHPNAGIQIPAGSVEMGEMKENALMREVEEETGLANLTIKKYLGYKERIYPDNFFLLVEPTKIYARPDPASFSWAELRKKVIVQVHRKQYNFAQITFNEENKYPNPEYITFSVTGWIPSKLLYKKQRRHFFHVIVNEATPDEWEVVAEPAMNLTFRLFWVPIDAVPKIVDPQDQWLEYIRCELGY
ncbi:MAG: NUDIX domain-containing protein, partial [Promethearchaeota archaeon]